MKMPLVIIQIVNYNGEECLKDKFLEMLGSIYSQTYKNFIVHMIDNNSDDASLRTVHREFPSVKITKLTKNAGYVANNIGVKYFLLYDAEYLLIMNNDIILDNNLLKEMIDYMESNPSIGAANPKIMLYSKRDIVHSTGLKLNSGGFTSNRDFLKSAGEDTETDALSALSGACMLVRREAILQAGLFDFSYGSYFEDVDFSLRLTSQTYYKLGFAKDASCRHIVSATYDKNVSYKKDYLILKNQYRLILKLFPVKYLLGAFLFLFKTRFLKKNLMHFKIFLSLLIESPLILYDRIRYDIKKKNNVMENVEKRMTPYDAEVIPKEYAVIVNDKSRLGADYKITEIMFGYSDNILGVGFSMLTDSFPQGRIVFKKASVYLNLKKNDRVVFSGYCTTHISVSIDGGKGVKVELPGEIMYNGADKIAEIIISTDEPVKMTYIGVMHE